MIPVIPWYITLIVIVTNVSAAVAVWSILSWAAGRSGLVPAAQRRFRIGSAVFFGAWLGAALLFAPTPAALLTPGVRRLGPLAHTMGEEEFEEFRAAGAVVEDVVSAAEDAILVEQMKILLLGGR